MNRFLVLETVLTAALVSGCNDDGITRVSARPKTPERRRMVPVRTEVGLTGRSEIECPLGRCVVLHYPPYEMNSAQSSEMDEIVETVLMGDASTAEDDGELHCQQVGRWCPGVGSETEVVQSTFNCCTFAVGDVVGLTTRDWIMGFSCSATDDTCPMQVILNNYFEQIRYYRDGGIGIDWMGIEGDPALQQDDVLCLVQSYELNGVATEIIHAGKIWKHEGRNWLISKLGAGPILVAPIESVAGSFEVDFDVVQVYRAKAEAG